LAPWSAGGQVPRTLTIARTAIPKPSYPVPAQIADHQTQQRTVFVEPLRDGSQLAADLVLRENLKYG
jgi:hypothetical protein